MCFPTKPVIPDSYAGGGRTVIQDAIRELAECCIATGVNDGLATNLFMSTHFPDGKPNKCMYLTVARNNGEILWSFDSGANWLLVYEGVGAQTGLQTATIVKLCGIAGGGLSALWLYCDGRAVDRIIYADLFAIIGTTYGIGDGSQTFNLPDMRGRLPMGANYPSLPNGNDVTYTTRNLSDPLGTESHIVTEAEMTGHTHVNPVGNYSVNAGDGTGSYLAVGAGSADSSIVGSDNSHNNMHPSLATYYVIRI